LDAGGIPKLSCIHLLAFLIKGILNIWAELLRHVTYEAKRFKSMQKPDKLYLAHPNLFGALCKKSEVGTMRETFFASMASSSYSIYYVDRGDFLVDEKYTFEIGTKINLSISSRG